MYKIILFQGYSGEIEKICQKWLSENTNIEIISHQMTTENGYLRISVIYKELLSL